jgi:hypothetical protein
MSDRMFIGWMLILFVCIFGALIPTRLADTEIAFSGDSHEYHLGAVNLVQNGMYSVDGETPTIEREPGQSFFLAAAYLIFGIGNTDAIFIIQGILYFVSVLIFAFSLKRITSVNTSRITALILLAFPPAYHAVFSLYRESITLSMFLLFTALFLSFQKSQTWAKAIGLGCLLGVIILTYLPFLYVSIFLIPALLLLKIPKRYASAVVLMPFIFVMFWSARNYYHEGKFQPVGSFRTTAMWYARAEQAEHVQGLDPIKCLTAEYITRDWSGLPDACSTNSLINTRWPGRIETGMEDQIAWESQMKIIQYLPHYLWFSVIEIVELHIPFVNGWGRGYNIASAFGTLILYIGIVLSLGSIWKKKYAIFGVLVLYTNLVFMLTDTTPRYLLPVIFCYAVLSAIGYSKLLKRHNL